MLPGPPKKVFLNNFGHCLKQAPSLRLIITLPLFKDKTPLPKNSYELGNCDIHVKQKILVINEMKREEISLKLKV
jgi:hypothetical protein